MFNFMVQITSMSSSFYHVRLLFVLVILIDFVLTLPFLQRSSRIGVVFLLPTRKALPLDVSLSNLISSFGPAPWNGV